MEKNVLSIQKKRRVLGCNFNEHMETAHPDRVMTEHDLIFIREGDWAIWQEGICYQVGKGDIILLQGGLHHYGKAPCKGTVKTIYVHFERHEDDKMMSGESLTDERRSYEFPVVLHCGHNSMAEQYLRQIIFAYWTKDSWSEQKASAYLELLLCEISRLGSDVKNGNQNSVTGKELSFVDNIKMQIKNTPDRFFSVKELADQYGFSERTISSRFKQVTGEGIHAWQLRLKCQMAEELIAHTPEITLKEVAHIYGFYDEYHFSKSFKKHCGYAPKRNVSAGKLRKGEE